jgi:hypothetical protein
VEHRAIYAAIVAGSPDGAREQMQSRASTHHRRRELMDRWPDAVQCPVVLDFHVDGVPALGF